MKKQIIYIKPININDQIEDKINKNIPIKTKERLSYFKNEIKYQCNINNKYFQQNFENTSNTQPNNKHNLIYQQNNKNKKSYNADVNNKKKKNDLKNLIILDSLKNKENNKNKVNSNKINEKNQKHIYLTLKSNKYLNNKQINLNFDEESIKRIISQRKCLNEIYNKDKRIINHSYNTISSSLKSNKTFMTDEHKKILKINPTTKQYKILNINNNKHLKNRKDNKNKNFGIYDPITKSLKYKHYSENRNDNYLKNKTLTLNSSKLSSNSYIIKTDSDNNTMYFSSLMNNIKKINNLNKTLQEHREKNEKNLKQLKKLIFNHKINNNYNRKYIEESKSNIDQNDTNIYKIKINEKIQNIINKERKELEKSINDYNKKLELNYNKKDFFFKNYNKKNNKYFPNLTDVDINNENNNEIFFDNINILTDFHFKRENKS